MRIVFLQDDYPPEARGGAGIVAATLARELSRRGHDISVITTTQQTNVTVEDIQGGVRVYRIFAPPYAQRWRGYRSIRNKSVVRETRLLLRRLRPDIVHAHNIHTYLSYESLRIAKKEGAAVFLTAHDAMLFAYGKVYSERRVTAWQQLREQHFRYNPFRRFFIRRAVTDVNQMIAVSESLAKALRANGFPNVVVIYNGIDTSEWRASAEEVKLFKEKHDLSGKKIVLFGGRISAAKGAKQTLMMMRQVQEREPDAQLLVVGTAQITDAKSIGWVSHEDMRIVYAASDAVVVPSVYLDPFPTVNLEAMASGKPVVATCIGGSSEIVIDGITGYVVDPNDTESFASRVGILLSNSKQAESFGTAGRQRVIDEFSLEHWVAQYEILYRTQTLFPNAGKAECI